ncbi:hypothetical protein H0H92_009844 [Tricholoma furcatifolium]|nr:hypothetical protein H0H92_009844 [Tricholoma furcatifolium]
MEALKLECDHEARRGARRMAMGGFGMLVVYWAAVARLTFWDYGCYLRIPLVARRMALYKSRGFDLERWKRLTNEASNLRRDILRIAEDYDEDDEVKEDENIKIPQDLNANEGERRKI